MSDNYETSAERELSLELDDVRAERDRLRAVVDAVLIWLRQMSDLACPVDVLHVADLYRTVTRQLDVSPTMGVSTPSDEDLIN